MILGGIVKYEDGVKTTTGDQFSPTRKVSVELNFAVPENPGIDADSVVQEVLDKAQSFVRAKLGLISQTPAAKTVVVQTGQGPQGKTKDAIAEVLVHHLTSKELTGVSEGPKKRGPKPKPVVVEVSKTEDWDTGNALTAVPSATADAVSVPTSEENWDAAPEVVEITDKTLNDKVQVKNGALKNPLKIRQLIAEYAVGTPVLRSIPQEKRQEFVDKLEALA